MADTLHLGRLSESELDRLADILEQRGENAFTVEEVDGLFAALVCSPVLTKPSEWMPAVFGNEDPKWSSIDEFQEAFGLLMRHWNHVAQSINDGSYEPVVSQEKDAEGKLVFVGSYWCLGFDAGMRFDEELWFDASDRVLERLLAPITFLRADILRATKGRSKRRLSPEEHDEFVEQIPMTVVLLRQYWLKRFPPPSSGDAAAPSPTPGSLKVGRNEPCPCGSGKKYKLCHGAGGVH